MCILHVGISLILTGGETITLVTHILHFSERANKEKRGTDCDAVEAVRQKDNYKGSPYGWHARSIALKSLQAIHYVETHRNFVPKEPKQKYNNKNEGEEQIH